MAMAGYSGTPLVKKLGVKSGQALSLVNAPKESLGLFADFPRNEKRDDGLINVTLEFEKSLTSLKEGLPRAKRQMTTDGMIWVAWPKKASGVTTDLNENVIREVGLKLGLVDIKVCAIDETWSGLKFVVPVKARAKAGARS
jgi:hypothetical protein